MEYMILLNTVAFLILMVLTLFYIDTSHKLNGCKYNRDQLWCFTDLRCTTPTGSKPIVDDLLDTLPSIKACNANPSLCACTDPSYNYQKQCRIKPSLTDHTGRQHCTYGTPGSPGYESATNGNLKNATNTAGTTNGKGTFDRGVSSFGKQPRSLLFCNDPTTAGNAIPNFTRSPMVADSTGSIPSSEWNKALPNTGGVRQANIGFDKFDPVIL